MLRSKEFVGLQFVLCMELKDPMYRIDKIVHYFLPPFLVYSSKSSGCSVVFVVTDRFE